MTSEPTLVPDEIAEAIDAINEAIDVGYLADSERLLVAGDVKRREAALLSARKLIMRLTEPTPTPDEITEAITAIDTAISDRWLIHNDRGVTKEDELHAESDVKALEAAGALIRRLATPTPFSPLAAVEASRHTPHPTRRITAKVTCVLVDAEGYEITVEDVNTDAYRSNWRFTVADAEHYPVGGLIRLTVPA